MSASIQNPLEQLQQAGQALDAVQKVLDYALADLRERSQKADGKISAALLDQHQLVSYDLALSCAEVTGARFGLDYAKRARNASVATADALTLEERFALLFTAEALQAVRNRLSARPADFGLDESWLSATVDHPAVRQFCLAQLPAERVAELGQLMRAQDGVTGAYLLDDHHEMMRETFRRVAEEVVMPLAEEVHRHDLDIPDAILDQVKELGCFGISIPERFGGIQSDEQEDNLGMIVVTEELTRGSLGAAGSLITRPEILSKALLKGGTEEQKNKWLPQLAAGDLLCAVAVTEPNYGSDVANMRLKATKTEGGWLLNGAKTWCTFGGKAGVLLILARTHPDVSLGHRGLSMFLLEKPSYPGHAFEFVQEGGGKLSGKAISTIGYRGMHSFDLFFDNIFVPEENMLGGPQGEGKGFYFTMAGFAGGRIQTAARALGIMQAAYEKALSYAQERIVFGYPIGDYQLTQAKLARMATYLAIGRQFTYSVGRLMDQGEGDMEASMVKFFTCKTAEWVTREALQIHGGMGYAEETPVSRYFIDARVLSIFEGAEETLALKVIARSLVDNAKTKAEVGV
ncbi:MAG TPA: acyl-CoA dehydrogenase family protein [Candidatus Competibacteraceae bacterium]|nr:MAG: acyl-CoA dehydrogenase [Candidatus Competibacteraceae bacterium]HOB62040.1 acyl-CoA dehydrogenase family protein [Candidatus Competibacteraceae bacterium]HQA25979.1 acyl-CoA dehydrogenase family protein [Candidatus Competibacteraceae bacterium]HQD56890.1 acyl-CoA dehydrogenase family protein [Candidatus Competibacteraceae bacterium]